MKEKILIPVFILFAIAGILLAPHKGFFWDCLSWIKWAEMLHYHGFAGIYTHSDCNYLPGFLYILKLFTIFEPWTHDILEYIIFIKAIVFSFEIFVFYHIIKTTGRFHFLWTPLILLNPALWYNSLVFAQVDGLHTGFCVLSFLFIYKQKPGPAFVFFVLAFIFKMQSIALLPLFGILWLGQATTKTFRYNFIYVGATVLMVVVILLPFPISGVWRVITTSVDFFTKVSMNAYNIWYLLPVENTFDTSDHSIFYAGLSYKTIGFLLFFLFTVPLYIFTFFRRNISEILRNIRCLSLDKISLIAAFTCLCFFFFFTQMHERYAHPAVLFGLVYALASKKVIEFVILSLAYVINMDGVMRFFMPEGFMPHQEKIAAWLYLATLLLWTYKLYAPLFRKRQVSS